jgi:ankyrin repeat protein
MVNRMRVPFAFTLASLGKLERLKSALSGDPELMTAQDKVGRSIVHPLVQNGRVEVVRYLLENGADPNASSKKVDSPLFEVYSADVVPVLVELGADPSIVNNEGNTSLHRVAGLGLSEGIVAVLLEAGVDLAVENNEGKKAVDLVDADIDPELVELLK